MIRLGALAACIVLLGGEPLVSAEAPIWRTGSDLQQALEAPVGAAWSGIPLRRAVENFGRSRGVAVILDRRIDPGQEISFEINDAPFIEVLERLGVRHGFGVSRVGDLIYLGPPAAAAEIRTRLELARANLAQASINVRRRMSAKGRLQWSDLSTPGEIIDRLATEGRVRIENLDAIPHDLWAAVDSPPLPLLDRLLLVSLQYDLTIEAALDGDALRLTPVSGPAVIERAYPGGANAAAMIQRLRTIAPDAEFQIVGSNVLVRGRMEDHESLTRPAPTQRERARPAPNAKQRYTLRVKDAPLEDVLRAVERKLSIEWRFDREALEAQGARLDQRISFSVRDATLEELLEAVLAPAGLAFEQRAGAYHLIQARKTPAPLGDD